MLVGEAKEKVCPFISGVVGNATDVGEYPVNCICGDCMAWEYTKEYNVKYANDMMDEANFKALGYEHDDGAVWIKELQEDKKEGYCKRLEK